MIFLKLLIIALCCWLWYKGGDKDGKIRDIPIPIILAVFTALYLKTWWLALSVSATAQIIRLGYGAYDPVSDPEPSFLGSIIKDRQGKYIRMVWGILVSVLIGSSLFFGGFLTPLNYGLYVLINAGINFSVCHFNMKRFWTDNLVGIGVTSIILLV